MRLITTFEANYERTGTINVGTGTCHVCSNVTDVTSIDSSEDEYGPGCICKDCVMKGFGE